MGPRSPGSVSTGRCLEGGARPLLDSPSLCDASRTQLWCESPGPPQFRPPAWASGCQFVPGQCLLDAGSPSRDARTFFRAHNVGQAPEKRQEDTDLDPFSHKWPCESQRASQRRQCLCLRLRPRGRRAGFPFYSSLCTLVGLSPSPRPTRAAQHPPPGPREPTAHLVPGSTSGEGTGFPSSQATSQGTSVPRGPPADPIYP